MIRAWWKKEGLIRMLSYTCIEVRGVGSTSTMAIGAGCLWIVDDLWWYLMIFDDICAIAWNVCVCAYIHYMQIELCMRVFAYALYKHIPIYTYCRWYVCTFVQKSMLDKSEGMEELQGEAWCTLSQGIWAWLMIDDALPLQEQVLVNSNIKGVLPAAPAVCCTLSLEF